MSRPDRAVLEHQLRRGLTRMQLEVDDLPVPALLDYLEMLQHWNQAYNLTGIRDPARMVAYHLLDSLAVLPYLHGARCLDMGTGAGLPGVVLALARPDQHWVLLDSNLKKTRFLQHAVVQLGIGNIEIVRRRVTDYAPAVLFDVITARALSRLANLCRWARPLLAPGGWLLALKGVPDSDELNVLRTLPVTYRVHDLPVPGIATQRTLITVQFND